MEKSSPGQETFLNQGEVVEGLATQLKSWFADANEEILKATAFVYFKNWPEKGSDEVDGMCTHNLYSNKMYSSCHLSL